MIHIECSTQIDRPRDEVFDFLTDVDKLAQWQAGVMQVKSLTSGPPRVGFQFAETARVGPWNLHSMCTVTDLQPGQRFAFMVRSSGPLDCDVSFDLQPIAGGTRLTLNGKGRVKGPWRLLQPMLAGQLRKETQAELASIKLLVETAGRVPAVSAL